MTTATVEQHSETIVEALTSKANVDAENGVIKNVKLIGFESKNGRLYPPAVLKAAVHLYEGAKVNINHPEGSDPTKPRQYQDRFGVIRSARFMEGSGIFGDFHFNPEHPNAKQVCWDAANNPEALGFSHNALLRLGDKQSGKQVIEQILKVRSMDLVADPATTASLFESENQMDPAATMDQPTTNPQDQIKTAFKQMIMAAIDDSSLDMKATMSKIKEIMKAQEKLMGGSSGGSDEGAGEENSEEQVQLRQQNALLQQQVEQFQAKEKEQQLVESIDAALEEAGLDKKNPQHVSELFSKQLLATEAEADRLALIKDRATLIGASPRGTQTRDNKPVYKPSTTNATEQLDSKEFARRLLTG